MRLSSDVGPGACIATVFSNPLRANFHTEAGAGTSDAAAGRANDYPIENISHRDWKMTPARSGGRQIIPNYCDKARSLSHIYFRQWDVLGPIDRGRR